MKRQNSPVFKNLTLKKRIFFIFLVSSLVPFICIALISYYTIYSILVNKIHNGIQNNLKQIELSLANSISNLNHVSQALGDEGAVGKQMSKLLSTDSPYERTQIINELKGELNLITFTNPSIGLTLYYFKKDGTYDYENLPVKDGFSLDKLPLLAQYYEISYYGPHISNNRADNQYVISAARKLAMPERDDVFIYIETGFRLTQSILDEDKETSRISHLILDNDKKIVYSELPDTFQKDTLFTDLAKGNESGSYNGFYWFKATSNQGWSVLSVIPKAEYNKEMNHWFIQILFFSLLFLAIILFLAWLLWRMVYRPLNKFNKEINMMLENRSQSDIVKTWIPEFDYLLIKFRELKKQIWELFSEVEKKEKLRADLEVEKLLYQINPHFLMNSLDTVHWMAVMHGQSEIDRLVTSLNKLLYYNLGKLGQGSTIQEEIQALEQYLVLQQIRYDFQFDVRIHVEENVLKMSTPRFILQPLVENALYHGLNDDGYIQVDVRLNKAIEISITDNGSGMSLETIENLLNNQVIEHQKVGMGIGLNYVNRMIKAHYGEHAELRIESVIGEGTSIFLSLPVLEVETKHD